jgi:hypothetical protein
MYIAYNDSLVKPSRYVIPTIVDVETEDLLEAIRQATVTINNGLKTACEKAEIKKASSHSARRSKATIAQMS